MTTVDDRMKMLVNAMIQSRASASAAKGESGGILKLYEDSVAECDRINKELLETKEKLREKELASVKTEARAEALDHELRDLVGAGFEPGPMSGHKELRGLMDRWIALAREADAQGSEDSTDCLWMEANTLRECAGAVQRLLRKLPEEAP